MLVYLTEPEGIHPAARKTLSKNGHRVLIKKNLSPSEKKRVEVLFIRTYTIINNKFLNDFPNLQFVLRAGVGLDNVDLQACQKRKIKVINAPGSNANAVAEFVVGLMILLLRNFDLQKNLLKKGGWREKELIGKEITGKTIGLIGCGAIGKLVTEKLQPFQPQKILGFDPFLDRKTLASLKIRKCGFNYLLKNADLVSLHLPLTPKTKNIVSLKELRMMKKTSYLINTSRGGIINEKDLITALKEEIISGAALDVFENEPKIKKEFLTLKNLLATPHLASYTQEADEAMAVMPVKRFLEEINSSS